MGIEDAIRRAEASADQIAADAHQREHVARAVQNTQRLLRDAVREFQAARAKPTHILRARQQARRGALRSMFSPPADDFEKVVHGWPFNRHFLGSDAKVYSAYGRLRYQVTTVEQAQRSKRSPTPEAVRGLLRIGLAPGDDVMVVGTTVTEGTCREIDLHSETYASPAELPARRRLVDHVRGVPVRGDLHAPQRPRHDLVRKPGGRPCPGDRAPTTLATGRAPHLHRSGSGETGGRRAADPRPT